MTQHLPWLIGLDDGKSVQVWDVYQARVVGVFPLVGPQLQSEIQPATSSAGPWCLLGQDKLITTVRLYPSHPGEYHGCYLAVTVWHIQEAVALDQFFLVGYSPDMSVSDCSISLQALESGGEQRGLFLLTETSFKHIMRPAATVYLCSIATHACLSVLACQIMHAKLSALSSFVVDGQHLPGVSQFSKGKWLVANFGIDAVAHQIDGNGRRRLRCSDIVGQIAARSSGYWATRFAWLGRTRFCLVSQPRQCLVDWDVENNSVSTKRLRGELLGRAGMAWMRSCSDRRVSEPASRVDPHAESGESRVYDLCSLQPRGRVAAALTCPTRVVVWNLGRSHAQSPVVDMELVPGTDAKQCQSSSRLYDLQVCATELGDRLVLSCVHRGKSGAGLMFDALTHVFNLFTRERECTIASSPNCIDEPTRMPLARWLSDSRLAVLDRDHIALYGIEPHADPPRRLHAIPFSEYGQAPCDQPATQRWLAFHQASHGQLRAEQTRTWTRELSRMPCLARCCTSVLYLVASYVVKVGVPEATTLTDWPCKIARFGFDMY